MFQITDSRLKDALDFASDKHAGQLRWGGIPFITHPVAVAAYLQERGYNDNTLLTALFHDLLEDTDTTQEEILKRSDREVLDAVILLTKPKPYDMADYLGGIDRNAMAKDVKCADRIHNLRTTADSSQAFRKKYYDESVRWYVPFLKILALRLTFWKRWDIWKECLNSVHFFKVKI